MVQIGHAVPRESCFVFYPCVSPVGKGSESSQPLSDVHFWPGQKHGALRRSCAEPFHSKGGKEAGCAAKSFKERGKPSEDSSQKSAVPLLYIMAGVGSFAESKSDNSIRLPL